jgi:hypothetical protein
MRKPRHADRLLAHAELQKPFFEEIARGLVSRHSAGRLLIASSGSSASAGGSSPGDWQNHGTQRRPPAVELLGVDPPMGLSLKSPCEMKLAQ